MARAPVVRETEHFFLDLPAVQRAAAALPGLRTRITGAPTSSISPATTSSEGLQGRPITRDIDWGIPVPLARLGRTRPVRLVRGRHRLPDRDASSGRKNNGQPEAWKDWWYNPDAEIYNFLGKDNIPFHTVIWPAELMGAERLVRSRCRPAAQPAVRCAGQRVHEHRGREVLARAATGRSGCRISCNGTTPTRFATTFTA